MTALAKILIIDDNPKLIADALPMYGYDVDVAFDGLEGIKKLNENKFDRKIELKRVLCFVKKLWDFMKKCVIHKTVTVKIFKNKTLFLAKMTKSFEELNII